MAYTIALANDLNTAEARAAIFDLVRAANTAADTGMLRSENATEILSVLELFDGVFAVLEDRDAAITRAALAWAESEGRMGEASPELVVQMGLGDERIEALIAERTQAAESHGYAFELERAGASKFKHAGASRKAAAPASANRAD